MAKQTVENILNQNSKKDGFKELLNDHVVVITFLKVSDGSERIMKCTLDPKLIPQTPRDPKLKMTKGHKEDPEVIAVWDLDKNGWRAFNVLRVTGVKLDENYVV